MSVFPCIIWRKVGASLLIFFLLEDRRVLLGSKTQLVSIGNAFLSSVFFYTEVVKSDLQQESKIMWKSECFVKLAAVPSMPAEFVFFSTCTHDRCLTFSWDQKMDAGTKKCLVGYLVHKISFLPQNVTFAKSGIDWNKVNKRVPWY